MRSREDTSFLSNVAVIDATLNQQCSSRPYYEGYIFRGKITRTMYLHEIEEADAVKFNQNISKYILI